MIGVMPRRQSSRAELTSPAAAPRGDAQVLAVDDLQLWRRARGEAGDGVAREKGERVAFAVVVLVVWVTVNQRAPSEAAVGDGSGVGLSQ